MRIRATFIAVCLPLCLTLLGFSAGYAQQNQDDPRVLPDEMQPQGDNQLVANLNFCRQLMREKNFEGASALLELLYEKHTNNAVIVALLVRCYDELQLYSKSEAILERLVTQSPDNFNFRLLLAEVLAKQGALEKAARAYIEVAALVTADNETRLEIVIESMIGHGLDEPVGAFIDSLRTETSDSTLFALHKGTLLERRKHYRRAALEYYPLLSDTAHTGNTAEKKVAALLNFPEAAPLAEEVLLRQSDLFSNTRALKVLSAHYLRSDQLDKAFAFAILQDSLQGFQGETLLSYMNNSFERRLYDETVRMGEYVLSHSSDTSTVNPNAHLIYAEALKALGRYDDAIAAYDAIYGTFSRNRERVWALFSIGVIYMDGLNDYDRALVYLDSVKNHYTHDQIYLTAMLAIPYCHLRRGDLPKAQEEFQSLSGRRLQEDQKEAVDYHMALIHFFGGDTDSARAALSKLLVDYPRGLYVNDAVRLMVTIDQARSYPQILHDYSEAMLFEQRRLPDSAAANLLMIWQDSSDVLDDLALYKLAEISLSVADTSQALGYLDSLIDLEPVSYYLPFALKTKAYIYLADGAGVEAAKDILRQLLQNYSDYPFISDVRKKLRQLEAEKESA